MMRFSALVIISLAIFNLSYHVEAAEVSEIEGQSDDVSMGDDSEEDDWFDDDDDDEEDDFYGDEDCQEGPELVQPKQTKQAKKNSSPISKFRKYLEI